MDTPSRAPARATLREIGPWLAPTDPHFVREFQFSQFDQRMWELYLWAAFRDMGFDVRQPEAPDFLCSRPKFKFTVEAINLVDVLDHPRNGAAPQTSRLLRGLIHSHGQTSEVGKRNMAAEWPALRQVRRG